MSTAVPFDTLAFVKELESAGIPPAQAEAQAKALATVIRQVDARVDDFTVRRDRQTAERFDALADRSEQQVKGRLDGLATKQELDFRLATVEANLKRDIKELDVKIETVKADLTRDIETSKLELRKDIESAKVDTIKWTAGIFAAQTALIIGATFAMLKTNQPNPQPTGYHTPPVQEMRLPVPTAPVPPTPVLPTTTQPPATLPR
ncbi:MAG: DUF1640 domain-containing protein [Magnetococcales bacterium]|nr:DUF1640 domain-containing protein [Magnetococcales bacterium]